MLRLFVAVSFTCSLALAQWRPPADNERCPSRWGADDTRGSANHMGSAAVLKATRLIRTGTVFELGHVLSGDIPFVGTRRFDVHTKRTVMNTGVNRRGSNEELVVSELGQVGTQFDGFAHQTVGATMYNCVAVEEAATRTGFRKLGVEAVGMLMTRGVLIDVARFKGVPHLEAGYEITVADLEGALKRQGLQVDKGDAILLRTGWSRWWSVDRSRYAASSPGIGTAAAEWLAKLDPMLVGADNPSVEVTPNPDKDLNTPVHQIMLVVHGIHILENLQLEQLAENGAGEFAFVIQPLKIQGGTGSTVAPAAIR